MNPLLDEQKTSSTRQPSQNSPQGFRQMLRDLACELLDVDMVEHPRYYWQVRFALWLLDKTGCDCYYEQDETHS